MLSSRNGDEEDAAVSIPYTQMPAPADSRSITNTFDSERQVVQVGQGQPTGSSQTKKVSIDRNILSRYSLCVQATGSRGRSEKVLLYLLCSN